MVVLTLVLAIFVGVSLGLLGGGGSILTVPLLVYVAGMETKEAIATSLLVVGVTSMVGAISHARGGRVQWRTGVVFGLAGMTGAYAGGRVAELIAGQWLLMAFALLMVATGLAMLRPRRKVDLERVPAHLPTARAMVYGLVIGLVTGLVGAGGGFVIVPALALLGGLPMPVAIGTSLVVIAMNAAAGLAGHLASVTVDWRMAAMVTGAAVIGALLGGRLSGRIAAETLRRMFGWFVLVMAVVVAAQEAPDVVWSGVVLAAGAVLMVVTWLILRRQPPAAARA
ncbi:MAG: sulfite exporter TauE/SafE family protein [Ornithinimicrobium sp.]